MNTYQHCILYNIFQFVVFFKFLYYLLIRINSNLHRFLLFTLLFMYFNPKPMNEGDSQS